MKEKEKYFKGFTLVELIIVITILAILATIAFISFQGYTKSAKDSNRIATLSNIQKGLDLHKTKIGKYPEPDGTIITSSYSGTTLTKVGIIGENISKLINIIPTPKDPLNGNYYPYGVSINNNFFQISATMENYDGKSKVIGSYNYPLEIGGIIYTIPSLIFSGNGGEINDTNTKFIVDKGNNVSYNLNGSVPNNQETITQSLEIVTGSGGLTMTGINMKGYTTGDIKSGSGITDQAVAIIGLGSRDKLGQVLFGNDYYLNSNISVNGGNTNNTTINSCSTTQPTNTSVLTIGTPTSVGESWQSTNSSNGCYFTCNSGYVAMGSSCVQKCDVGISEITLPNGQTWSCKNLGATTVWDGITPLVNCDNKGTTNCNSSLTWVGDYYQWGRNDPLNTTTTIPTYSGPFTGSLGHNDFVLAGDTVNYDWWQNEAGSSTNTRWSGVNPQGPCSSGWHVPTQSEWNNACDTILGGTCSNDTNTTSKLQDVLKLPFAGSRSNQDGYYVNQSSYGYYQSSNLNSTDTKYSSILLIGNISPNFALINHTGRKAAGYSVRCLKN